MLRKVDRILLRVPSLPPAVRFYTQTMGLRLVKQDKRLASLAFIDDPEAELILHTDADLPAEATYYRVDDVRDLYARRQEMKLTFVSPPTAATRGWRATIKDPFGTVLLILDRMGEASHPSHSVEDAKPAGALFAGIEPRVAPKREALISGYEKIGRTADDLPYTPHFESLFQSYAATLGNTPPTRAETWRHLLNLRKAGKLPKMGDARSKPPEVSIEDRDRLRDLLGVDIGKRDRLPYTDRFDTIVDQFNRNQSRPLSPHLVWRLVATLAK